MSKRIKFQRDHKVVLVIFIVCFALFLTSVATSPGEANGTTIRYVDVDAGGGLNNGSSWTNAYIHLQDALDQANADPDTDHEIWVAEGIYYPDLDKDGDHTSGEPSESFTLRYDNLRLYGGFSGSETLRSQRDPVNNVTILSGDIDDNDTNTDGNNIAETWTHIQGENTYKLFILDGESHESISPETVIDGFVITAGDANAAPAVKYGAGLYCLGRFAGNTCSPTLRNLIFSGNHSSIGGAIMNDANNAGESSPVLIDVIFLGNRAEDDGGGMYNFSANSLYSNSNPTLINVQFLSNSAGDDGGAMYNSASQGTCSPSLTNVVFHNNASGSEGGGMHTNNGNGTTELQLTNVTFANNHAASQGGGMKNFRSGGTFSMEISNAIFWGNTAGVTAAQIYNVGTTPIIQYSDIEGSNGSGSSWDTSLGTDAGHNIDQDPLFTDPSIGDVSLKPPSPAIDAGNQSLLPADAHDLDRDGNTAEQLPDDVAHQPRVQFLEVDMGAYEADEKDPASPAADFDGDGTTDISVYRPANGNWYIKDQGSTSWGLTGDLPVPADYDGDGSTDIAVYRPSNGKWYIMGQSPVAWGFSNDVPMPCDYDGDGTDEIAVYRPSNGKWYILGQGAIAWGRSGDIPVPGDYDGDGSCDIGVFRPSNGKWYIKDITTTAWAYSGDIPVPADYNGDGAADIAVFRPTNGKWYIMGQGAVAWGFTDDIPVPGDYDGDGDDDIAVLRPSNGKWYIKDQGNTTWYQTDDYPLPVRDTDADGDPYQ
jgi:hypothetical protein